MATNFPASLDTFTNPAPTDNLSTVSHSGQHDNINDAMAQVQAKIGVTNSAVGSSLDFRVNQMVGSNAPAQGFLGWSMDPAIPNSFIAMVAGTVYASGIYLPAGTVTNIHLYCGTASVGTHCAAALYTSSGTLLSQTADQTTALGVTGLKTWALGAAQAISAGYYYVAVANAGSAPSLLGSPTGLAAIINIATASPPIGFRGATSGTAYATTMPSPLGTLSSATKLFWVACS